MCFGIMFRDNILYICMQCSCSQKHKIGQLEYGKIVYIATAKCGTDVLAANKFTLISHKESKDKVI